uniref:RxLR effector candidate protein n=2 Tax=Hyaloperonospora arabidopsidis (strain Emoy2) TaxID=559515 RepID=M4B3C7_HYAAE
MSGALVAAADPTSGSREFEVGAPDAIESKTAKEDLLRSRSFNGIEQHEDRSYLLEGVVGKLITRFTSVIVEIGDIIDAHLRALVGELTADPIVRKWESEVDRMVEDYYKGRERPDDDFTCLTIRLRQTPGFRNVRPKLKQLIRRGPFSFRELHNQGWENGITDTAKYVHMLKMDPLHEKYGYELESKLFTSWILKRKNPEDIVAAFLSESESSYNSDVVKNTVAHYMEFITLIAMILPR